MSRCVDKGSPYPDDYDYRLRLRTYYMYYVYVYEAHIHILRANFLKTQDGDKTQHAKKICRFRATHLLQPGISTTSLPTSPSHVPWAECRMQYAICNVASTSILYTLGGCSASIDV